MRLLKKYDVFISYAVEDKHTVAEQVYQQLIKRELDVFFLGRELQIGDSISGSIYEGLERSRYCIVILSPDYNRYWTSAEADEFRQREFIRRTKHIFPLWHNITFEEVSQRFPWLHDKYGMSTGSGFDRVGEELYKAIKEKKCKDNFKITMKGTAALAVAVLLAFLVSYTIRVVSPPVALPSNEVVMEAVNTHINNCEQKWDYSLKERRGIVEIPLDSVIKTFNFFIRLGPKDPHNEYKLSSDIIAKKRLLSLGFTLLDAPYKAYGMTSYVITRESGSYGMDDDSLFNYCYVFSNRDRVVPQIDTIIYKGTGEAAARISYTGYIRHVYEKLVFAPDSKLEKRKLQLMSFKPTEEFTFEMQKGKWVCTHVN